MSLRYDASFVCRVLESLDYTPLRYRSYLLTVRASCCLFIKMFSNAATFKLMSCKPIYDPFNYALLDFLSRGAELFSSLLLK